MAKYATSEVARARRSQPTIRSVYIFHNDALSRCRPRSFTDVLSVRSPPSRKPQSAAEVDFTPLLGLTAGVVLFSALASARAPPTPSIDANLVLVCTVLAGFAAFVFTGDDNASAASPMPDAAPAGAPAEPARKRDRLLKILRRKAAVATDTTPADAPTYAAEPETGRLGRFALFRARFSRVKSMT